MDLKINQFLQDFSHKEALLRKHRNAIKALQSANKNVDFDKLFSNDPRKMSKEQEIDIQDLAEKIIKNCVILLDKNKRSGVTITNYLSSIKTLFEHYHIELPHSTWKKIKKLQTRYGDSYHPKAPTKEQIQKILSNADAIEKAFYLTMLTTGLRPEEIVNIELNDLHLEEQPPRISITTANTATKRRLPYAYITEEAKIAIKNYIPQRPRYFNNKKISNLPNTKTNKNNLSNKLFPIAKVTMRSRWNDLLKHSELHETRKNGTQKRHIFNFYTLKYYFRSYLGNPDLAEHLIGHIDMSNQYSNKQDEEIKKDYLIFSKNLYINSNPVLPEETKKEIDELTNKMKKIENQLDNWTSIAIGLHQYAESKGLNPNFLLLPKIKLEKSEKDK